MTEKSNYSGLEEISISSFCNLRMEAEIALLLGTPLKGKEITDIEAIGTTASAMAAVELVGGRIRERKTLADLIADNSGHAGIILGSIIKPIADLDLTCEKVVVNKNGHYEDSACSNAVMGNPINAVYWLANKLSQLGHELNTGSIISTGSLTRVIPLEAGDKIDVSFANLGVIHFKVTK